MLYSQEPKYWFDILYHLLERITIQDGENVLVKNQIYSERERHERWG